MQSRFENSPRNAANATRSSHNIGVSMDIALEDKKSTQVNSRGFQNQSGEGWVELYLPIETVSEANGGKKKAYFKKGKKCYTSEHWNEKNRRHQLQKGSVSLMLRPLRNHIKLPCVITLTRYATHKLDKFDNLPMSLKYILDAICEVITGDYRPGRADNSIEDQIDVIYKQVVAQEYGVNINIRNV